MAFSTVFTILAQGNLLGNIVFFLQVPPPGRSPDFKASASREENCILIIRHIKALASTEAFWLPRLFFFLLRFFLFYPKLGSAGLCSKNRVLGFRASLVKQGYHVQNYARQEVYCSNYAGLKQHFHPTPHSPAPKKHSLSFIFEINVRQ